MSSRLAGRKGREEACASHSSDLVAWYRGRDVSAGIAGSAVALETGLGRRGSCHVNVTNHQMEFQAKRTLDAQCLPSITCKRLMTRSLR